MWYIIAEGRKGYYNGYSEKGINSPTITTVLNDPDGEYYAKEFDDFGECELNLTNIQICPIFKKDATDVKTAYSFSTKEDADKYIAYHKRIHSNIESYKFETWSSWMKQAYFYVTNTDKSKMDAVISKMKAFEDTEHIINKKHNYAGKHLAYNVTVNRHNSVCNCCRITLGKDEHAINLGYYEAVICINCSKRMTSMLETEYKKHPQADDLTTAWELEKMNEDVN